VLRGPFGPDIVKRMMPATPSGNGPTSGMEGVPRPGDVVAGKFVVERVLGVGGMGVVVSARHAQMGQKVAIKFLRKDANKTPEAVNRFLREARAVVGLQSAHVVRVMDVGTLDDGMPYIVMEHLVGTDLHQLLEERKRLPPSDAVDFLLQGMEAIAEAHAVGIVHRDLKPANLFLTRSPDGSPLVKVLDFGISKASSETGSEEQSLTATSTIMGSPLYMSPEQLRSSKNVDARTDVWALGIILHELLVGRLPFEADTVMALCTKIAADPPTALREIDPSLPAGLEVAVLRCLEKDVKRRLSSVAELAVLLQPFASAEGRMAVERIARIIGVSSDGSLPSRRQLEMQATAAASSAAGQTDTAWQQPSGVPRRRTATYVTTGIVGLVLLGLAVVVAPRLKHGSAPPVSALSTTLPPASVPVASATLAPIVTADVPSAVSSASAASAASSVTAGTAAKPPPPTGKPAARPAATQRVDDLLQDRK
jgi:eukaryotic-like serine/threonine-protein kinase